MRVIFGVTYMMVLVNGGVGKTIICRKLYMMNMGMFGCLSCSSQASSPALMSCNLSRSINLVGPAIETLYKPMGKFSLYNT
jgi:hypothetical protein